jgi:hypothetical protein
LFQGWKDEEYGMCSTAIPSEWRKTHIRFDSPSPPALTFPEYNIPGVFRPGLGSYLFLPIMF